MVRNSGGIARFFGGEELGLTTTARRHDDLRQGQRIEEDNRITTIDRI
jgi:hypothetical protein